jgi:diguanylate cyclase (GGDEF)-like protein
MRILLVEDDEILSGILTENLSHQRHVVDVVEDGQSGWDFAQDASYDLIVMDVGLPYVDGITVCRRLRSEGCATPILLMTAKDASSDRIRGLDAGADDYVVKPFDIEEFQARVRALLRRGEIAQSPILQVGELQLDPSSCEVTYGDRPLKLTPKEYGLLELFLRNPSRVFSRGQIIEHLWTFDDPPLEDSVKAHIKGLRHKLKKVGAIDWIENVYGIGYRFHPKLNAAELPEESSENTSSPMTSGATPFDAEADTHAPSAPMSAEQDFNQAMAALWERYRDLMVERMRVLTTAAAVAQTSSLSDALRQDAERAAHKLAGVLGMFNRDDGTQIAHSLEVLLSESDGLNAAQQAEMVSLVQQLDGLLNLSAETVIVPDYETPSLERPPVAVPRSPSAPSTSASISTRSLILVIGMDESFQAELQEATTATDVEWSAVTTLKQAQTWLRTHTPDVIVMDLDHTGDRRDSLSLIAELGSRTPPIPVLVMASGDRLSDRVNVVRAGGQGFLAKPMSATMIWDAVQQRLQQMWAIASHVLVVDDDPVVLAALRSLLEPWGIRMTGLSHPQSFWETLQTVQPDLLILDIEMPDVSGIELCQAIRTAPTWQNVPILFLTAHQDRKTLQLGFAVGADDYVTKPIVGPELLTRITNRLERGRLLQRLSTTDALTGLANQAKSSAKLANLLQQAHQTQQSMCFVLLHIVQLRQINCSYGHEAGHQVLQRWGQLFQSAFRGAEVVGYWGHGEFVVGIPGLIRSEIGDRLSDVLAQLRTQIFTTADGRRFQVDFQVAIAEYPTDGHTLQSLYQVSSKYVHDS